MLNGELRRNGAAVDGTSSAVHVLWQLSTA